MRMPEAPQQRACGGGGRPACQAERLGDEHEDVPLRRVEAGGAGGAATSPPVQDALHSPGQPLDSATRAFFEPRFGYDFSHVRTHVGEIAAAGAKTVNALAYTVGRDIVFGEGQYTPNQREGRWLLAHELAHVAQQGEGLSPRLQKFEAPIHESIERYGLTTGAGGLSQKEASAVYFGNWMRDMNQVFVPMVIKLVGPENIDVIYAMLNYLAFKKFGQSIAPEQFGFYIPAEHIDSPGGIVSEYDLLPGQPTPKTLPTGPQPPARPSRFVTPQESVDPATKEGLGANIFSVDQTGVMAFIRRSNLHVERRLELAAERGRTPEGMIHFGAALHAVEDLFAHSNWIEIAVSKALSESPALLPQLKGAARQVFTFSVEAQTPKGKRPVLTTGSFTGKDTQMSISSELVTLLDRGLADPASEADKAAQEQLTKELLRVLSNKLQTNPQFRASIRNLINSKLPSLPGRDQAVDNILTLPLPEIYELTRLPNVPDWVKNALGITDLQKGIREAISIYVMKPLGRQLQTASQETHAADTSLLKNLEENQAGAAGNWTQSDKDMAAKMAQAKGTSSGAELKEKQTEAQARVATLKATPEAVLAGPSHTQIAKDHPNSPFFGIAILLASIAVRSLREKMVAAWDEKAGKTTMPYQFSAAPTDPKEKALYDKREKEEQSSLKRGEQIVNLGREIPAQAYDLAAMRKSSAAEIRAVASALRVVGAAPGQTADVLLKLQKLLEGVDLAPLIQGIAAIRGVLKHSAVSNVSGLLNAHANALDAIANAIEGPQGGAPSHDEREAANLKLRQESGDLQWDLIKNPSIDAAFAAAVRIILQRQLESTAVSWTKQQRDVLEGRSHVLQDTKLFNLKTENVTLPGLTNKTPAVQQLLQESRKFLGHPYDDGWWKTTVNQFIQQHPAQMLSEIEARNAGYLLYRTSGGKADDHH